VYGSYLNYVLPAAEVQRLVFWSPTDISWMNAMCEEKVAEYMRADGLCDHRPGLINSSNQLKPAYSAVVAALQNYAIVHRSVAGQEAEELPASVAAVAGA
jgi:hypothetical protein